MSLVRWAGMSPLGEEAAMRSGFLTSKPPVPHHYLEPSLRNALRAQDVLKQAHSTLGVSKTFSITRR